MVSIINNFMNEIHLMKGKKWVRMQVEHEIFHLLSDKGFIEENG